MWILLCLVVLAHAEQVPNSVSAQQTTDEIAFLRSEILHIKNAVWGILYGLNDPAAQGKTESEITMGFRERYTSPYGEAIRKSEEELMQRRLRLFDQCLADAVVFADRYPEGSNIVKIDCNEEAITRAAEMQLQQERAYLDLVAMLKAKWGDTWDDLDDDWEDMPEPDPSSDDYYDA